MTEHIPTLSEVDARHLPAWASAIQVLLAEKRTSLAVMRTAIAVAAVPLSITAVLVALSRLYSWVENLHFLIPMYTIMTVLIVISLHMLFRSVRKIRRYDRLIGKIRSQNPLLREIVE